jgi:hypothetical protein
MHGSSKAHKFRNLTARKALAGDLQYIGWAQAAGWQDNSSAAVSRAWLEAWQLQLAHFCRSCEQQML